VFKNKLFNISLIIIIAISLLGIITFFLYQYTIGDTTTEAAEKKPPTIDEILPLTVNVPKLNTNLGDSTIIVLELTLQTDNEKAKIEADKRMYQIKDRINLMLKNLTIESFSTEEKITQFKSDLMLRLNKILQEGKVVKVDITQIFLQ